MSRHGRYSVSFTLSLARSLSRVCGARFDLRSDGARSLSRIAQRSLLCNELLTSFMNLCDVQYVQAISPPPQIRLACASISTQCHACTTASK